MNPPCEWVRNWDDCVMPPYGAGRAAVDMFPKKDIVQMFYMKARL
jgi:hypothetical protein